MIGTTAPAAYVPLPDPLETVRAKVDAPLVTGTTIALLGDELGLTTVNVAFGAVG